MVDRTQQETASPPIELGTSKSNDQQPVQAPEFSFSHQPIAIDCLGQPIYDESGIIDLDDRERGLQFPHMMNFPIGHRTVNMDVAVSNLAQFFVISDDAQKIIEKARRSATDHTTEMPPLNFYENLPLQPSVELESLRPSEFLPVRRIETVDDAIHALRETFPWIQLEDLYPDSEPSEHIKPFLRDIKDLQLQNYFTPFLQLVYNLPSTEDLGTLTTAEKIFVAGHSYCELVKFANELEYQTALEIFYETGDENVYEGAAEVPPTPEERRFLAQELEFDIEEEFLKIAQPVFEKEQKLLGTSYLEKAAGHAHYIFSNRRIKRPGRNVMKRIEARESASCYNYWSERSSRSSFIGNGLIHFNLLNFYENLIDNQSSGPSDQSFRERAIRQFAGLQLHELKHVRPQNQSLDQKSPFEEVFTDTYVLLGNWLSGRTDHIASSNVSYDSMYLYIPPEYTQRGGAFQVAELIDEMIVSGKSRGYSEDDVLKSFMATAHSYIDSGLIDLTTLRSPSRIRSLISRPVESFGLLCEKLTGKKLSQELASCTDDKYYGSN